MSARLRTGVMRDRMALAAEEFLSEFGAPARKEKRQLTRLLRSATSQTRPGCLISTSESRRILAIPTYGYIAI